MHRQMDHGRGRERVSKTCCGGPAVGNRRHVDALTQTRREGTTVINPDSVRAHKHPAMTVAETAAQQHRALAAEFGTHTLKRAATRHTNTRPRRRQPVCGVSVTTTAQVGPLGRGLSTAPADTLVGSRLRGCVRVTGPPQACSAETGNAFPTTPPAARQLVAILDELPKRSAPRRGRLAAVQMITKAGSDTGPDGA
jgi:hypothetical protein